MIPFLSIIVLGIVSINTPKEEKSKPSPKQLEKEAILHAMKRAPSPHQRQNSSFSYPSEVIIVDAEKMAQDWIDGYHQLKKGGLSPTFLLQDGKTLTNISHIEALSGGYLILFTIKGGEGTSQLVVKTSAITSCFNKKGG